MIGAVIGDIVGSVYEWDNIKTKYFLFFARDCSFTDDTVMSFAVASALLKSYDSSDLELFKGELIKEMQRLGRVFPHAGYGGSFKKWLRSDNPKPYHSYGNGSAMRVSPVGYIAKSLAEAENYARASAEVTHNHPEGIKGAVATAGAVYLARNRASKEEIKEYALNYYDMDFTLDEIRDDYEFDVSCQGTVPPAIEAFLEGESYEDTIRNAISLGGDSDTLAAIAGAIAEPYFGIPAWILEKGLWHLRGTEFIDIYKRFVESCYFTHLNG